MGEKRPKRTPYESFITRLEPDVVFLLVAGLIGYMLFRDFNKPTIPRVPNTDPYENLHHELDELKRVYENNPPPTRAEILAYRFKGNLEGLIVEKEETLKITKFENDIFNSAFRLALNELERRIGRKTTNDGSYDFSDIKFEGIAERVLNKELKEIYEFEDLIKNYLIEKFKDNPDKLAAYYHQKFRPQAEAMIEEIESDFENAEKAIREGVENPSPRLRALQNYRYQRKSRAIY